MITSTQLIKEWGLFVFNSTQIMEDESFSTSSVIGKTESTKRFNVRILHHNSKITSDAVIDTILFKAQCDADLARAFNDFVGNSDIVTEAEPSHSAIFSYELDDWSYNPNTYEDFEGYE